MVTGFECKNKKEAALLRRSGIDWLILKMINEETQKNIAYTNCKPAVTTRGMFVQFSLK